RNGSRFRRRAQALGQVLTQSIPLVRQPIFLGDQCLLLPETVAHAGKISGGDCRSHRSQGVPKGSQERLFGCEIRKTRIGEPFQFSRLECLRCGVHELALDNCCFSMAPSPKPPAWARCCPMYRSNSPPYTSALSLPKKFPGSSVPLICFSMIDTNIP